MLLLSIYATNVITSISVEYSEQVRFQVCLLLIVSEVISVKAGFWIITFSGDSGPHIVETT